MNFIKYLVERQISFIEEKENLVRKEKRKKSRVFVFVVSGN